MPTDRRPALARLLPLTLALLVALPTPARTACLGMELHAHRGSPAAPENSLSAIQLALEGSWDGAETDIQQLRDQAWVLHHDDQLGRTTSLQGRAVRDIDSATWREVRMKDRQGRVSSEKAPFMRDVAAMAATHGSKVFNVEIKQGNYDCTPAHQAVSTLHEAMPGGQWFLTSIERRQLQCARKADPEGYLGQVVLDPQALALSSTNRYVRNGAARLASPTLDKNWLDRLVNEVGSPVGIHIDTNTLAHNPGLLQLARQMNIAVFTYNLDNDREHAQALRAARRQGDLLPSGAIINGQPDAFCQLLSTP
jgi:glycerophosphoryl diester phosphodiesterase